MALTKVSGDFIQDGSITQGHLHASHGITTSDIGEGSNLYFTTARVDSRIGDLSTSNLSEGTNLYYTDARADARIALQVGSNLDLSSKSTSDLSEGTNLYYTQARFNTAFTAKSTSDLSEGTNLYYTDARVGSYLTTNNYLTASSTHTLTNKSGNISQWTNDSGYITDGNTNWDNSYGFITASSTETLTNKSGNISMFTNDSGYITDGNTNWNNSYGFITASSTDTLTNKSGNISQWTNDSGYITGYTETDTLATVTGRGASTSTAVTFAKATFNTSSTGLPRQITIKEDGDTENSMGSYPGAWTSALNIQSNDASTYLWLSPLTSNIPRIQTNYGQLDFYTGSNTNRALHLSGTSARSEIFYDSNDTNTYFNSDEIVLRGSAPQIALRDTDQRSVVLHNNSNRFYVLGAPADSTSYAQINGVWPWYVQLDTNNVYTGNIGYAGNSYRAPIFYDSNDTAFYLDPASTSYINEIRSGESQAAPRWDTAFYVLQAQHWYGDTGSQTMYAGESGNDLLIRGQVAIGGTAIQSGYALTMSGGIDMNANDIDYVNQLHFNDNVRFYDNNDDSYINFKYGDSNYGGIRFLNGGGTQKGYIYADNSGFGVLDNDGNWALRTRLSTNPLELYCDNNLEFEVHTTYTYSPGSSRAPIFYDSDNTGYYLNPNGTSNLSAITITDDVNLTGGGIGSTADGGSTANVVSRILIPQGGAGSWDGTQTGAIKIRLPIRANNNMWTMKVRIYNYSTNTSQEYLLGNYSYSNGGYNSQASFHGGESSTPRNVRFGNDGTYDCVWIGETNTTWAYPVVSVLDFQAGFRSASVAANVDDYDVSIVTSFGTVQTTISPNTKAGSVVYADSSFRAPLFYDTNNTSYFTDPASTTVLNGLNTNSGDITATHFGIANTSGSTRDGIALYGGAGGGEPTYGLLFTGTSLGNHGGVTGDWATYFTMNNDTNRGWIFRRAGTGNSASISAGGLATFDNSVRSPIFYDSNDTNYFIDPRTATNGFKFYSAAGAFYLRGQTHWDSQPGIDLSGGTSEFRFSSTGGNLNLRTDGWLIAHDYVQSLGQMYATVLYDNNNTVYYLDPDSTSLSGKLRSYLLFNDHGAGVVGTYSSYRYQLVFAMGNSYKGSLDGTSVSGGYGLWYSHPNAGGVSANLSNHGLMNIVNGSWHASLASSTRASSDMRAPIFYDLNNTGYYVDPASWSNLSSGRIGSYLQIGTTGNTTQTPGINMGVGADMYWRQSTYSSNADVWIENEDATHVKWKIRVSSFDTTSWTDSIVIFNHNFWRGYVGILRSPEYPLDLNGQARLSGGYTTSDVRLKKNIRDNELGLSHLLQLRTRLFDWITDEEILGRTLAFQNSLLDCRGFIAQEVEEVVPELVDTSEGDQPTKSIDDGAVTAMMVKAIQEQQAIIDDLKARIEILENQ